MQKPSVGRVWLWVVSGGLVSYCAVLTFLTGDIGFEGDDWWIFSWPYWQSYVDALWSFARDCRRPLEGLYWITLFELVGFNKVVFHLCSLLLLAGASVLMGLCLAVAFPHRPQVALLSALFAFFLPTTACLTYVLSTDNSRLSLLLFWASVLAFQRWTAGIPTWKQLLRPISLYILAFLTYEAPSFLLFAMPLFVWPVRLRHKTSLEDRTYWMRLGIAVCGAFVLALGVRFLLLSGGAVEHRTLLPPWELVVGQLALLPFYLIAPFTSASDNPWVWLLGTGVAIGTIFALSSCPALRKGTAATAPPFFESRNYLLFVGFAILFLGLLPYQLAGYGSIPPKLSETVLIKWGLAPDGDTAWFNFNWSSRIYSAGTFGLAILLATILADWAHQKMRLITTLIGATAIGGMALFHAGLSDDWKAAASVRNNIISSLLSQAPEVLPKTNFLFVDLSCVQGRAPVFRGWNGLRELVRILYDDPTLGAWYVYPYAWKWPNVLCHQASVSEDGFVSRGVRLDQPIPLDSIVLFRRVSSRLTPLDRLAAGDRCVPTGICWHGIDTIQSNTERILGWSSVARSAGIPKKNMLTTGLIETFRLSELKLARRIPLLWQYRILTKTAQSKLHRSQRSLK